MKIKTEKRIGDSISSFRILLMSLQTFESCCSISINFPSKLFMRFIFANACIFVCRPKPSSCATSKLSILKGCNYCFQWSKLTRTFNKQWMNFSVAVLIFKVYKKKNLKFCSNAASNAAIQGSKNSFTILIPMQQSWI